MDTTLNNFLFAIAQKAGNVLMDSFQKDHDLIACRSTAKEAATKYDKIVDSLIIHAIRNQFPTHSILTEESGLLPREPDWLWIVDSLDGTGNFANHNPLFCLCIAVLYKGSLCLGTIYAPAINEFYWAEKGKGAYLNQTRIHVSKVSDAGKSYLFYCEGGDTDRTKTASLLTAIYPHVTDIRKLGAAGLETAWVAAGRGEAYVTTKIDPWDVAPGVLLVSEAGGAVTDFAGKPWQPQTTTFIASNREIHSQVVDLIGKIALL
ncbi:MAG: inositol monophosphatase [Deltaproteobacteria bacterium]|nr:inositol monophosphatase [Deltaproteobacteria bacterium]